MNKSVESQIFRKQKFTHEGWADDCSYIHFSWINLLDIWAFTKFGNTFVFILVIDTNRPPQLKSPLF